ncbi:MAG: class I SAM-dependent methyltransferase [Oscillochloris sp.]|nr:class I SAM-dependent methyltransferase [Oscillochloris sp.]
MDFQQFYQGPATPLQELHAPYADLLRAALRQASPAGAQLAIDIGCGPGLKSDWLAEHLAQSGRLIGIDIERAALVMATHARRASWVAGNASALPLINGCADLCWCVATLGLLNTPHLALAEARRVLRPGGTLVVANATQLWVRPRIWPAEIIAAWADRRPPPPADDLGDSLVAALATAGFTSVVLHAYLLANPGLSLTSAALPLAAWESLAPIIASQISPETQAACNNAEHIAEPEPLPLLIVASAHTC